MVHSVSLGHRTAGEPARTLVLGEGDEQAGQRRCELRVLQVLCTPCSWPLLCACCIICSRIFCLHAADGDGQEGQRRCKLQVLQAPCPALLPSYYFAAGR
jgi:hypothetical protein